MGPNKIVASTLAGAVTMRVITTVPPSAVSVGLPRHRGGSLRDKYVGKGRTIVGVPFNGAPPPSDSVIGSPRPNNLKATASQQFPGDGGSPTGNWESAA